MIIILRSYGIPDKIVNTIEASYASTRAKVYSPDGVTEEFDIVKGVIQGDTLSPYLFVIILDYGLRKAIKGREEELGFTIVPRRSRRVHPIVLTDLDFSDDIALISDSVRQASELLQRVESESSKVGLFINYNKTKVMAFNTLDPIILKTADGQILDVEKDFEYLGSWINSSEKDIKVRKALAWNALHSIQTLWKSKTNLPLKRRLFVETVESVLLYGSESWTLNVKQQNSLDATYT